MRSEFDLNKYIRQFDDRGTYLSIDNGHLNQKKQTYVETLTDNKKMLAAKLKKNFLHHNSITPGPGSYETNISSVISTQDTKKKLLGKLSKKQFPSGATSPRLIPNDSATGSGRALKEAKLQNLSIPSIPSRFLTPVLRFDLQEKDIE